MIPVHEEVPSPGTAIATVGGSYSGNVPNQRCRIVGIRVRPLTASTIYDLALVDKDSFTVWKRTSLKGEYCEDLINLPILGIFTASITNATANEAFTVKFMVEGP